MTVRLGGRARSMATLVAGLVSMLLVVSIATIVSTAPPAAAADPPAPRLATTSANHSCATVADDTVRCWGFDLYGQTNVPADLGPVVALAAGGFHTCAVKADDTVRCWGAAQDGATAVPADLGTVTSIAAGGSLSCAIRTDGTPRCWGRLGSSNELALPADIGTVTAISVHTDHGCAIKTGGIPVCWGGNANGKATIPAGLGTVISISAGEGHSCAVKTDGTPVCWGDDSSGQATVPADVPAATTIAAGRSTCMLATDGTLRCWGDNSYGQATPPPGTYQSLSSFFVASCAVSTANEVACWGPSGGVGSSPEAPAPAPATATRGQAYSHTFTSSRGAPAGNFAVTAGGLPAGLSLSADGVLSGTPTVGGDFSFTVTAASEVFASASAPFVLHVDVPLVPPQNIEPARITGFTDRPRVDKTLTAKPGTWTPAGATFTYQWYSSTDGTTWTPIFLAPLKPANTAKYRPVYGNVGQYLRVSITATNPDGSTSVTVDTPTTVGPPFGTVASPREPEPVTKLTATAFGPMSDGGMLNMDVTWKASFDNGRVVDKVRVEVVTIAVDPSGRPLSRRTWELDRDPVKGAPTFDMVSCPHEQGCRIIVTSHNQIGWGEPAETIGLFRVPAPPTVGSTTLNKAGVGINGRLTPPADQGGLAVTGYRYDVSKDGGPFEGPYELPVTPVGGTSRQLVTNPACSGAQLGCSFRYYAVNALGMSEPSVKDSRIEWKPPGAVGLTLAKSTTPGVVNATITPPKVLNGLPILGYEYSVDVDGQTNVASGSLPADATSASIPCPDVTSVCRVTVIAFNLTGSGTQAGTGKSITFSGNGRWVATSPKIVGSSANPAAGATDLTVQWTEPSATTAVLTGMSYEVQVCSFGSDCHVFAPSVLSVSGARRQATVPCPAGGLSCTVQVRSASASVGYSSWTAKDFNPGAVDPDTFLPTGPLDTTLTPIAPESVSVADVGGGDVEISWEPFANESQETAPFASVRLAGATVLACDAATGCDDVVDWTVAADVGLDHDRSAIHTCGFARTCRYMVVSRGPGGTYGHVSETVSITMAPEEGTFNDSLADAVQLTGFSGSVVGTNVGATNTAPFEPATCVGCNGQFNDGPHATVWYQWMAPTNGTFQFATCGATTFDTTLAVYTGSQIDDLTRVANDDQGCSDQSVVQFTAFAGVTYSIQVDGYAGSTGSFTLSWSFLG